MALMALGKALHRTRGQHNQLFFLRTGRAHLENFFAAERSHHVVVRDEHRPVADTVDGMKPLPRRILAAELLTERGDEIIERAKRGLFQRQENQRLGAGPGSPSALAQAFAAGRSRSGR